jgi:hypothetical protein
MFIDFFEIAFIVVPLLVPVAEKLLPALLPPGSDALIWFGVIIAMNLQTSFLTPPFGFALFYLRSVAAKSDYNDRLTGQRIPAVTTTQIYKGAIAFIVLQVIMIAAVVTYPNLVLGSLDQAPPASAQDIQLEAPPVDLEAAAEEGEQANQEDGEDKDKTADAEEEAEDDPAKALQQAVTKSK